MHVEKPFKGFRWLDTVALKSIFDIIDYLLTTCAAFD